MKIRKLTPSVLKRIIAEEKAKIRRNKKSTPRRRSTSKKTNSSRASLVEKKVNQLTKLALLEVKEKIRIKKIQKARAAIKKSLR